MILKEVGPGAAGSPGEGLIGLEGVPLPYNLQRQLDTAVAGSGGSPEWCHRKTAETRDMLVLSRLAPNRVAVEHVDLSGSLRAMIRLRAPLPTRRP